ETTHYLEPTLRLLSKTSSATGAQIAIDVQILGQKAKAYPLDDLILPEVRRLTKTASTAGPIEKREVGGYAARIAETPKTVTKDGIRAYRIALIDHADFVAEEKVKRRQLVKVILSSQE